MSVAALVLSGSFAVAATEGSRTDIVPYDQCVDLDTAGYSCATGRAVLRVTITPSGALTGTQLDNGRYEFSDGTDCVTSGNYQQHSNVAAGPAESGHVVQHMMSQVLGKTRCADRTLDARCLVQTAIYIQAFRDAARVRVETRVNCDPPA
jgi:hypothetical protein